jgi:hypothetical protein
VKIHMPTVSFGDKLSTRCERGDARIIYIKTKPLMFSMRGVTTLFKNKTPPPCKCRGEAPLS